MHRRIVLVVAGLMILQLGTGCCRWRAHRISRIQDRHERFVPDTHSCSSCESSPISAIPVMSPISGPVSAPTLGVPSSAEPPVRMPILSSRPITAPVGLRR